MAYLLLILCLFIGWLPTLANAQTIAAGPITVGKILDSTVETIKKDHEKYRTFILKGHNEFPNPF